MSSPPKKSRKSVVRQEPIHENEMDVDNDDQNDVNLDDEEGEWTMDNVVFR